LAECFETLGGVPRTVLADRMGCLKAGVVANVVVPTADYVRFATHYLLTELGGVVVVSSRPPLLHLPAWKVTRLPALIGH
jgi:hypothetical protein